MKLLVMCLGLLLFIGRSYGTLHHETTPALIVHECSAYINLYLYFMYCDILQLVQDTLKIVKVLR